MQTEYKLSRRKEIIKIKLQTNEMDDGKYNKGGGGINEPKGWFFEKTDKIDELTKKKEET